MIYRVLKKLKIIYEANFILVIAIASTAYIHSSYLRSLGTNIPEGILFALGSLGGLICTIFSPVIFKRLGVERATSLAGIINAGTLVLLALNIHPLVSIIAFVIALSTTALIVIGFDIIIEHFSKQKETGGIRGVNLALGNLAFLVGPIIAGMIAEEFTISYVYFFSALTILVMVLFFHTRFKNLVLVSKLKHKEIIQSFKTLWQKKDLRNSYLSGFAVEFFFAIWAIFTTIYMNTEMGFNWEQIGILFALMHIPYIILEPIIGEIADKHNNENHLMALGLCIIGVSFLGVALIDRPVMVLWALLLIITRIGASFGQVAHESYFFKKINDKNSNIISAYRSMSPLALLLGPVIGSIILLSTGYKELFIIVSVLVLLTIIPAYKLNGHGKRKKHTTQ
jgi:MFS family permease